MNGNNAYDMALYFQRGDEKGFTYFYKTLWPALLYYAYSKCDDMEVAKDILEDSFVKIWETHHTFSHPKVIRSWLYTTVRNDCFNRYHQHARTEKIKSEVEYLVSGEVETPIDEDIIRAEVFSLLHQHIDSLPKQCRKVFKSLYINGKTVKETAEEFGVAISTIKNQKARGLMLLRQRVVITQ